MKGWIPLALKNILGQRPKKIQTPAAAAADAKIQQPHAGERAMQERAGTTTSGAQVIAAKSSAIAPELIAFLEARDLVFLATADGAGRCDAGVRAGEPGFIKVLDPKTLVFPDFPGNGSFMSLGNLVVNSHIGMLFIDFERRERVRVNGRAEVSEAAALRALFPGAARVVRVEVEEVFRNCRSYLPRMRVVEPARSQR
jgi:predicted pyridoxine 5'-phosphate oxidase superfamily flavin-nucleotide-binding protein